MLAENFEELHNKHVNEIYHHCFRILRNEQDADEICSEAFVKAFFHRDQFDVSKGNFRNWIFTIATHLCLDFIKSAAHRKQQQTQYLDELIFAKSNSLAPDENSEHSELMKFIADCLSELIEAERIAVSSRHLQDFSLQEIASMLGMSSPNSAKNRIKSGEKKLRQCLEKKGIDDNYWHGA
jgi:RNA polymerase sigma-70 factor (ECF subfamily)